MKIVAAGIVRDIAWGPKSITFVEDPSIALGRDDFAPRQTSWIRQIVLHTTTGEPYTIASGAGHPGGARQTIDAWRGERDADGELVHSGAHFVIDYDGTVYQCADVIADAAYHAKSWNQTSVGIEVKVERKTNSVYEAQHEACADLVDVLTAMLGVQRMIPPYPSLVSAKLAKEAIGVFGHCHLLDAKGSAMRGPWDPGPPLFQLLERRGYELVSYNMLDRPGTQWDLWISRQKVLGLLADGIPGPKTVTALRHNFATGSAPPGRRVGVLVHRPCDEAVADAMGW